MAPPTPDKPAPAKAVDHPTTATTPSDKGDSALQRQATDLRHQTGDTKPAAKPLEVDVAKVAERLNVAIKPADLDIVAREREIRDTRRDLTAQMSNQASDAVKLQATQDNFKRQVGDAITTSNNLLSGDKGARAIDRINDSLGTTERHQADLEKTLKLNPENQQAALKVMLSKDAGSLTPTEKDYIETLTLKQALRQAKESGSITNAVYGSAVANGLIGDIKHRDANGMATPSPAEVSQAFTSMGIAHRLNGESREAGPFTDDFTKVAKMYTTQLSESGKNALDCLTHASENYNKNPAVAENLLRAANATVDGINLQQVQRQLEENKDNPEIAAQLKNVLNIANSSRMEYASFLYDNGRMAEAAVKLNQAAAETPDQARVDPSYASLFDKVNAKSNGDRSTLEGWQTKFTDAMNSRNWAAADEAGKHIQDQTKQEIAQMDKAKVMLDQQTADLNKKLASAAPEEKAALQAQLAATQQQADNFTQQRKIDNTNLAFQSYKQGFIHLSEKNMAEAHKDFLAVQSIDPNLYKQMNEHPPGDLPKLDDLIKQTTEPTWWQSHWRLVAGIGIGVLATAAVIATAGAALPAIGIVVAGGGLYAAAGATAGETSLGQLGTNFGIGCATTAVSVLLKGVPMWRAGAAATQLGTAEATSTAVNALAAEGVKDVTKLAATESAKNLVAASASSDAVATSTSLLGKLATGVRGLPGATLQTGKDVFSLNTVKALVPGTLKQTSAELGVTATLVGAKEGIWDMGVKGENFDQVKKHMLTDAALTYGTIRLGSAMGASSSTFKFIPSAIAKSGLGVGTASVGYGFTAVPELQNYYKGNQSFDDTMRNIYVQGSMNALLVGQTKGQIDKYITTERAMATGSLNLAPLATGSLRSFVPLIAQESFISSVNYGLGLNKPLDPTTAVGNRKTTANWLQYDGRIPDQVPGDPNAVIELPAVDAPAADQPTMIDPNAPKMIDPNAPKMIDLNQPR